MQEVRNLLFMRDLGFLGDGWMREVELFARFKFSESRIH